MRKSILIGGVVLLSITTIAMMFFWSRSQNSQSNVNLSGVQRRLMKTNVLGPITFEKEYEADLYTPSSVWNGMFYCYNHRKGAILIIDSQGSIQNQIGKRGNSPGEFQRVIDIDVDSAGVHLIDGNSSKITTLSHTGAYIREQQYKKVIERGIRLTSTKFLFKTGVPGTSTNEEFEIYDINNQSTSSVFVKRPLQEEDEQIRDIQVDGFFVRNTTNTQFFRISYTTGQFVSFDNVGKPLYTTSTIDNSPLPKFDKRIINGQTGIFPAKNTRTINLSATADKDYLYILSNAASPTIKDTKEELVSEYIIDVYNAVDGSYSSSFSLPNTKNLRITDIILNNETLYITCGGNVLAAYPLDKKQLFKN
jgi:hypothetical protein